MAEHENTYDLFQRGREHMRHGDNAQATVSLEKAKRREPDKASIREALGVAYLRMQRYQEAAAEFEHILAAAPANDYAHYCLGRCLARMGNRRVALGHYKMAVWLRPSVTYYQEAVDGLLD
ncbi:MAG TPA: tetratricopeptide repeat protein [Gaiellales bacterium]|jgi:tetratricopeptide (TPR) repeat protein|nr:tetratricopeptide repeat protein [Gaiellales bacterium]